MQRWHIVVVMSGLALLALFPSSETYWRLLICQIASSALLAISFDICLGFTGMLTMATALFFGLGAFFFSYALRVDGLDVTGALALTVLAVFASALVTGALAVRLRGPGFLVLTLLLTSAAYNIAQNWRAVTNGDDGFALDPETFTIFGRQLSSMGRYYFCLAVFALGYLATVVVVRSPLGLLMRSVRENDFRVELLGLNPYAIKLIAFCFAGVIGGLAGVVYAASLEHVHAGMFDPAVSGRTMLWAFFGGVGTLVGPLIGAAVLVPFEDYMSSYVGYPKLFTGIVLVVIVLAMHRSGVLGLLNRAGTLLGRRTAPVEQAVEVKP
jgi:branched-chain amino acid transport system permease protein